MHAVVRFCAVLSLVVAAASSAAAQSVPGQDIGWVGIQDCVRSLGYWSTRPVADYPADRLVLGDPANPRHLYGARLLSKLLVAPTQGDASLILAKQLIAARFNIASGARPDPVLAHLTQADQLLGAFNRTLPYGVSPSTPAGAAMVQVAAMLEQYNTGQLPGACEPVNRAPIANAGADRTVAVGATVTLDGSGSSDPDGQPVTYRWTFVSIPANSVATLVDVDTVAPTFVVDVPGRYEVRLIVNDGLIDSAPDTVVVSTSNSAPTADAGPDQTVAVGTTVSLTGAGSTDPDGDPLQYAWRFVSGPAGSTAQLTDATSVTPSFVVDRPGTYVVELVVFDGSLVSAPDTVAISTVNSAPVARAGADVTGAVGDRITLDGTASSDVDGDPLTFRWAFVARPAGSAAALDDPASPAPAFTIDAFGEYVVQLIVNDGSVDSTADTVVVSTRNSPPVADAGPDQAAVVGSLVTLDGSGSTDVDGQPLTYRWALLSAPAGSTAQLSDPAAVRPTFAADLPGTYVAQLVVNDGLVDSMPDTVTITTVNTAPVADAGADATGRVGDRIVLNGAGSRDADGDPLTYRWSFVSRPAGSQAVLEEDTSATPAFTIDAFGAYVVQLIVHDGFVDSAPDTVTIDTENSPPVAHAGPDQTVAVGARVTLDGAGSTDIDGQTLTYRWALIAVPTGSEAVLSDPAAVRPEFIADVAGTYVAQLIVNDGVVDSEPDTVVVTAEAVHQNQPPVADAGPDQTVDPGATVQLDGSGSNDPDGNPLSYRWSLSRPAGSHATLSDPNAVAPTFVADVPGTYVAQLIVNDGFVDSAPDTVTISTTNTVPVAHAGPDQRVAIGATVTLDGSASSDADGTPLTYAWAILSQPAGGTATLSSTTAVNPTFVANVAGDYVVQLIVNDGLVDSAPDTVVVTATAPADLRFLISSAVPASVPLGGQIAIGFRLHNDGPAPATGVSAHIPIPAGTRFAYFDRTTGSYDAATGIWTIPGTIAPGQYAGAIISVFIDEPGTKTISASVRTSDQADPNPENNSVAASVPVSTTADVRVSFVFPPSGTVTPGSSAGPWGIWVRVQNFGPATATGVVLNFTPPPGYTITGSANGPNAYPGDYHPSTGVWNIGRLGNLSVGDLVLTAIVNPTGSTALQASVSAEGPDPDLSNNVATAPPINRPPAVSAGANRTVPVHVPNAPVVLNGVVTDPEGDAVTYQWAFLLKPMGSRATLTGETTATPSFIADERGSYVLRLTASDGRGGVASSEVTITGELTNRPPVIRSAPVTGGAVGAPYRYAVYATDPDAGDTLTFSLTSAPDGMSIDAATGVIDWTPDAGQAGPQAVDVRVTDAGGLFATQAFAVQVSSPSNGAPVAADDAYEVRLGESVGIGSPGVLQNDSDESPLSARLLTSPANGSLLFNPDGSFTYTPFTQRPGSLVTTGRVNLATALPGVTATSPPAASCYQCVIDGNPETYAGITDNPIDIRLPQDVTIEEIQIEPQRRVYPDGLHSGIFTLYDASGGVLYSSGNVEFPAPERRGRLVLPQPVSGVRQVRFARTAPYFAYLSEIRLFGTALLPWNPTAESNLAQRLATRVEASSFLGHNVPDAAIDDTPYNWYATSQSPGEYIQLTFPVDVEVTAIRGRPASATPGGLNSSLGFVCNGTFQLLDGTGIELWSTGLVNHPNTGPGNIFGGIPFDFPVPGVAGVRAMRYTSAGCTGAFPLGFREIQVIGTPAGEAPAMGVMRRMQVLVGREAHSTPIVVNLTDDNLDGRIDVNDIPDIIVPVEGQTNQLVGDLKAVSGDDGRELFTTGVGLVSPWAEVAAADLDGDGRSEIVAIRADGNGVVAFDHTGALRWTSDAAPMPRFNLGAWLTTGVVSIANLDGAGPPEVIVGATVFDASGRLLGRGETLGGTTGGTGMRTAISVVADIDLDGVPELIAGPTAYRLVNGALVKVWQRTDRPDGFASIGNFDDDPEAEIVIVADGTVYMLNHDGSDAEVWNPPAGTPVVRPGRGQGGAALIADVDGDGRPEIGIAGAERFVVLSRDGAPRWSSVISDRSSNSTGSVAFDLDGDGTLEIIYRDEFFLRIYRGHDGLLLAKTPVQSATWGEIPVVADVDNDGHADIVVSSDYLQGDFGDTGLIVISDAANRWTRTRRIWNQHAYHITNVNEDGSIPAQETPHWLLPGLNADRINAFAPGELAGDGADSFTYVASDGVLESNIATVRITVRPVNAAPTITSTPVTSAAHGVAYLYAARAVDPDAGDILTWSLTSAPAGMTIDAGSGFIRWTPGAAQTGAHEVVVKVADVRGLFALQAYTVTVGAPVVVPNVVGQPRAAAESVITGATLAVGIVSTRHSPTVPEGAVISQSPAAGTAVAAGAAVNLAVSLGPAPAGTVPDVVGQTQASAQADIVAAQFVPGPVTGQYNATVPAGIVLAQTPLAGTIADLGTFISLVVSFGPPPGTLDADGDGYTGDVGDCNDTDPSINPGAFDIPGDGIDQNCNGVDSVPGDDTAPTALLITPDDLAEVTMPTDIVGTVADANFLRYTVQLAEVDATTFTTIGSGTTAVTGGVVGRLDPTLLENGLYRVRLIAEDVNGQTAVDERVYRVAGAAKVGHLRLSFTDLSVPVAGVPISVVRTYDSRVKSRRDFGVGWTLELKTGTYRHNRIPGEGWIIRDQPYLGGTLPCIGGTQETRTHLTEVRLSDREFYRFALDVTNGNLGITGACEGTASFRFVDGSRPGATLDILGSTSVIYLRGGDDVVLDMDAFLDGTHVPYDPAQVRLTLPDGTRIDLARRAGVTRIADLNGNSIDLTPQGILHSSGRSIRFERDAEHRITRIIDPRGLTLDYAYDSAGDLTAFTDQAGQQTTFRYDATHLLIEIRDALGRTSQNEYDVDGRLIAVIDPSGNRTVFTRDLDARIETIADRLGHRTEIEYDVRGNVVRLVDPLGGVSTFTYDARDNLLTETDPLGHTRSFTYDERDNVLSQTDPLGHTTTFTYSATNQLLTRTDPQGGVTSFAYDSRGNVVAEVDATGARTTHTYDASGNRTSTTDPTGGRWTFAYDSAGRVTQTSTPVGQVRETIYDANGNALVETRRLSTGASVELATTQFVYDPLNRRVRLINAGGAVHEASYTATGQVATQTDAAGGITTYTYDDSDRLVRVAYPDGTVETAAYDAEGRRVESTDRAGRTTRYSFDALGRLVTTTYAGGTTVRAEFDAAGRQVAATDELGRTTTFTYDEAGRMVATRDPLGAITRMAYDERGNVVSSTDGNGNTTTFGYDAAGRRTRTTFADGHSAFESYDALGRRIRSTDAAGNVTQYEYDARGALTRVIDPLGHATSYRFNDLDKLVSQTDALGQTTRFTYDNLGRLTQTTLPLGQTELRGYDIAGRLLWKRDYNGGLTRYTYDGATARLATRTLPDGEVHAFTYTPTGRIATVADPTGTTTFEYDLRDRPTLVRHPDGTEIRYAYDATGNRTALTTPSGTAEYTYDLANRLSRVTDLDGGQSTLAYDAAGNLTTLVYPNGVEAYYQYDTVNRLTDLTYRRSGTTLQAFSYTLGPVGNRTRVVEHTGRTIDYTYDALFRLTGATVTVPGQAPTSISYAYDAVGNRVSQTGTAGTVTYAHDSNGRLIQSGGQTFTYDANGNLRSAQGATGFTSYDYDAMNRLVQATIAGTTTQYAYNAIGHRVRATGPDGTTGYLIDPFGADDLTQIVRETGPAGAVDYVRGGGMLISMRRPTGTSFYLPDGRASTRLLTDSTGAITDLYDYDPFGNVTARQGITPNEFLFAGQRLDAALGLYDLRARQYDPRSGRFTTRDPFPGIVFDPGSLHPYTYAHNDPVNRSDPSGQFTLAQTMAVSAGVGVLAGIAYAGQNYYYYRSSELAFEIAVDAAFTYGSLTMDMLGIGGLVRTAGREIIRAVATVVAGKTLLNQTSRNVGRSAAQRLTDVFDSVLCRTNSPRRCGLTVISVAEASADIAEREALRRAAQNEALEQVRKKPGDWVKKTTVTEKELAEVTVATSNGVWRTVVQWFERRPRFR